MGRDIRAVLRFQVPLTFQSTRPRGARLFHAPKFGGFVVSIHAPTWGATDIHRHTPRQSSRFNPRAHVGRDYVNFINDKPIGSFNPRAHVGRDCSADTILRAIEVSIHAPTWGATFCCARNMYNKMFQSTRPRGARQQITHKRLHGICFNPRAHVGRDRCHCQRLGPALCFNPRAHVGRDP